MTWCFINISVNIASIRHNFFMSCNYIVRHSSGLCDIVQLQLHESYALPTLSYATASITFSETQIASLRCTFELCF